MNNKTKRKVIIVSLTIALLLSGSALTIMAVKDNLRANRTEFKIKQKGADV